MDETATLRVRIHRGRDGLVYATIIKRANGEPLFHSEGHVNPEDVRTMVKGALGDVELDDELEPRG